MSDSLKRGAISRLCLFLALGANSCNRSGDGTGNESVSWTEFTRLDDVAYRTEGFARAGDLRTVRESLSDLLDAGKAVTPATTPANAANTQQVRTNLTDLTSVRHDDSASSPLLKTETSMSMSGTR
jgi:hypothetical protein